MEEEQVVCQTFYRSLLGKECWEFLVTDSRQKCCRRGNARYLFVLGFV